MLPRLSHPCVACARGAWRVSAPLRPKNVGCRKSLTVSLNPLDRSLTKNRAEGALFSFQPSCVSTFKAATHRLLDSSTLLLLRPFPRISRRSDALLSLFAPRALHNSFPINRFRTL